MNRERLATLIMILSGPGALAALPCEERVNVLLDAWGMQPMGASSAVAPKNRGSDSKVTLKGHDSPSAEELVLVHSKGSQKNMRVVIRRKGCLLQEATVYTDGRNSVRSPVTLSRSVCRAIFKNQQLTPWEEKDALFQEKVMRESVPGWSGLDEESRHVFRGRILSNCGQTPANAGKVVDRIGALGYLSFQESALQQYFTKKDANQRVQGMSNLMQSEGAR